MKILGISRGVKYSPNMVGYDAAIFMAVKDELTKMGHEVSTIREEDMVDHDYTPYDRVMTMARNSTNIVTLMENLITQEKDEILDKFYNSLRGAFNCTSKSILAVNMFDAEVPQPNYRIGYKNTYFVEDYNMKDELDFPIWIKSSDNPAMTYSDTLYCETPSGLQEALKIFEQIGVRTWLIQEHKDGDLIKFYGVEGTNFFHWHYASQGHSKFGLEAVNGKEKGYPFNPKIVHKYANKLAKRIDLPIYGGDAIIDKNGMCWFIDFNDFPSFSSCREKAAKAIAKRIVKG